MSSIEAHKDAFWSTPIQSRHDSGYGIYDTFGWNISPIRKKSADKLHDSLDSSHNEKNSEVKVIRKLSFTRWIKSKKTLSSHIEKDTKSVSELDSGIECSNSLKWPSLSSHLKSFPSDLKSDIKNYINNNRSLQPLKYVCKEGLALKKCGKSDDHTSLLLDENNNVVNLEFLMKKKPVDFLYELNLRNCAIIISQILSYVSSEDLSKACCVSKDWHSIISADKLANERRKDYIDEQKILTRGPNKENKLERKCLTERSHKSAFLNIINTSCEVSQQPLHNDKSLAKFDSFCEEAKTLHNKDGLMKCLKCNYPSKIKSGDKYCCTRNLCQYEFCKKCSGPFLDNHACSEVQLNISLPSILIGSKKSKKNLRRL